MQRRLVDLTARPFDVLVIGGGICGLTVACDAAQRGLTVALVERHDFGSGTSFNHLRTIHGGLRYLQHLDIPRARESIAERRTLAAIAPWAVSPTPFVLPLRRSLAKGRLAMRAGFALDGLLAKHRNRDLPASHHLPSGHVLSPEEARQRYPLLRKVPMTGAAVWHDYVATDADRLTFSWAQAAAAHGAVLANYVSAGALRINNQRLAVVTVTDRHTDTTFEIVARTVVNATGADLDHLLAGVGLKTGMPVTKAMNLVTNLQVPRAAIGGRSPAGRNFFMVPWQGRALFGTWESGTFDATTDVSARAADVSAFVRDISDTFPSLGVTDASITLVHRGIVPAVKKGAHGATPDGREQLHDHALGGYPQIISVAGTKYTTARAMAEKVTTRLLRALGRPAVACRTATTALPTPPSDGEPRLLLADQEMVATLEDAVVRRTRLGALGAPAPEVLTNAARIVGGRLGWAAARRAQEIDDVRRFYADRAPKQ